MRDPALTVSPVADAAWKAAWFSEIQAVAIYEAECWALKFTAFGEKRKRAKVEFEEVLGEEKEHALGLMENHASELQTLDHLQATLNRLAGRILGVALTLLPVKWSYAIHVWAERQASEIYRDTATVWKSAGGSEAMISFLREAENQEELHARRFERLRDLI